MTLGESTQEKLNMALIADCQTFVAFGNAGSKAVGTENCLMVVEAYDFGTKSLSRSFQFGI